MAPATYTLFFDLIKQGKGDQLSGPNWSWVLRIRPRFAIHCHWDKLDGRDWGYLLRGQPQFADRCDWDKLEREDWNWLVTKRPQFKEHPMYKLKML